MMSKIDHARISKILGSDYRPLSPAELQAIEAVCKAKRSLHWDCADRLLAEARQMRAALERIAAECGPAGDALCVCLDCTRQTHAWMIARQALQEIASSADTDHLLE